jgi:hypothetical protein
MMQGAMGFMQIAAALGALAGGRGRGNATFALTAFGSAVKGFATGKQQEWQEGIEQFKAAAAAVRDENEAKLTRYKAIWQNKQLSTQMKLSALKLAGAEADDELTYNAANMGDIKWLADFHQKQEQLQQTYELKLAQLDQNVITPINDATIDFGARYLIKTGKLPPLRGYGKSASNIAQQMLQRAQEIETSGGKTTEQGAEHMAQQGINYRARGIGSTAEARSIGARLGPARLIVANLEAIAPTALAASDKVPRKKWVPINQLIQNGKVITSDPDLKDFAVKNLQVAELWARAMNLGGVMRETDRDLALKYLNTADGPEAYKVAVRDVIDFAKREGAVAKSLQSQLGNPDQGSPGNEDEQAIAWARANPGDPRARAILQHNGVQ